MKLTGAQALIKALEMESTEVIFGLPGGCILPAYDPLFDKPYEAAEGAEAPSWEKGPASAPRGVSSNIKPKKKVAALFGAKKPPVTADSES